MDDTQVIIRRARAKLAQASKKKDIEDIREEVSKVLGTLEPIKEFYGKISRTELIEIKGDKGDKGERGNLFLGSFKTLEDLPDEKEFKQGDYAYIESEGEIWYIG
jgi:hypothetical protein